MLESPYIVPVVAIVGAFSYAIVHAMSRARVRELQIRERIAMIEKGLVPPPEVDPTGFERAMHRYDRHAGWPPAIATAARHRRAGIILVGIGLALMVLIGVAGEDRTSGIGVGGFLAVLGAAFLLNALFEARQGAPAPLPGGPDGDSKLSQ